METLAINWDRIGRYIRITRLHEPWDLGFLVAAGLSANWMAAGGVPPGDTLFAFLLGALAMRCGAWVFCDFADARFFDGSPESLVARGTFDMQTAVRLFTVLCAIAFASAIYLGRHVVMFSPLAWGLLIAYPYARQHTFLSSLVLALATALAVPIAWLANGETPGPIAWLLFVFVLMWSSAFLLLYALPRRDQEYRLGARSLVNLVGDGAPLVVGLLQAGALAAAALAGQRASLGPLFEFGWLAAAMVAIYQLILLVRARHGDAERAYQSNLWLGLAIFGGIAAHYVCLLTKSG
ncbi:UbiA family prenyltransferase [Thiohalomonas denitrificans]|uniref:UbiA family prenyltransferase n=1 Tax=Thiohalomonas denitrificans TaxID=415747 RepID=UPI0026EAD415|nr:UbiA family prenyltransferase [Thiohalomonas denitrificans]